MPTMTTMPRRAQPNARLLLGRMRSANLFLACIAAVLAFGYGELHAEGLTGDVQFFNAKSRHSEEQKSLAQVSVYLEKSLAAEVSVFAIAYYDQEFRSAALGLAKKFDDWQFGLGLGQARYGNANHLVVNPWLYYATDSYQGYLHAEYYSNGLDEPRFFKGYWQKKLGRFFLGAYGESKFGLGPRLGANLLDEVTIWINVPVANRPTVGAMKYMAGLSVEF